MIDPQHDRLVDEVPGAVGVRCLAAVAGAPADEHRDSPVQLLDEPDDLSTRSMKISAATFCQVAVGLATLILAALLVRTLDEPATGATVAQMLTLGVATLMGLTVLTGGKRPRGRVRRATRVAVIGSQSTAVALEQELAITRVTAFESVGWIESNTGRVAEFPMPPSLGSISDLATVVERHHIDLLVIGSDVPRLDVFDELVRLTDVVGIRVCELSAFYEDAFGRIPVAEINSTWFQYVMHPKFNPTKNYAKRCFDLSVVACLSVVAIPLLLVAAALIKLEGGSLLYKQRRIGERGRPFTMYKLRTMRERGRGDDAETWCSVDDPRVTRIGRGLRRLHIDELPQLYNILRGEMSVVGPRPEQPNIVARLESEIAFYSRRHVIKPGLAGWAQLRCGYARTDHGSAWKLCHDLYYLKHQSLRFDLVILVRTLLTLALPEPRENAGALEPLNSTFTRDEAASVTRT